MTTNERVHIHAHNSVFEALLETETRQWYTDTIKTRNQSSIANSYSSTSVGEE